jgi:hypothetical protein
VQKIVLTYAREAVADLGSVVTSFFISLKLTLLFEILKLNNELFYF